MGDENKKREFLIALPIALSILLLFVFLQMTGLVRFAGGGDIGYGSVLFIGLIASLSTCMAVVGGLLLSMSATFAQGGDRVRPQVLFHVGRFIAFAFFGGLIGVIGTAFTLNTEMTFALNLIIGMVMLILGLKLLGVSDVARQIRISFPRLFRAKIERIAMLNHTLTPFLVGVATFFMPCGFTQSMQLYTLGTGGFFAGALTMLAFALGTFPVLALVSFSSLSVSESAYADIFYKTAGLIVVAFALMNIINSLVIVGFVPPIFTF